MATPMVLTPLLVLWFLLQYSTQQLSLVEEAFRIRRAILSNPKKAITHYCESEQNDRFKKASIQIFWRKTNKTWHHPCADENYLHTVYTPRYYKIILLQRKFVYLNLEYQPPALIKWKIYR